MNRLTNGLKVGTTGSLNEDIPTSREWIAERQAFEDAMARLVNHLVEYGDGGLWARVRVSEVRGRGTGRITEQAESWAGRLLGGRDSRERCMRASVNRDLFNHVLTRLDMGDGTFPWVHVESALPEIAAAVMEHATLGAPDDVITQIDRIDFGGNGGPQLCASPSGNGSRVSVLKVGV